MHAGRLCFCTGVVVSYFFTALARFQGRGSSEVSYFVSLLSRGALDLEAFFLKYAFVVKERYSLEVIRQLGVTLEMLWCFGVPLLIDVVG